MPKLMEILEFLDDSGNVMVKRIPDAGSTEIKWGGNWRYSKDYQHFSKSGQ
jgi:hypothetical protein